jgi:hypothetical protein
VRTIDNIVLALFAFTNALLVFGICVWTAGPARVEPTVTVRHGPDGRILLEPTGTLR